MTNSLVPVEQIRLADTIIERDARRRILGRVLVRTEPVVSPDGCRHKVHIGNSCYDLGSKVEIQTRTN